MGERATIEQALARTMPSCVERCTRAPMLATFDLASTRPVSTPLANSAYPAHAQPRPSSTHLASAKVSAMRPLVRRTFLTEHVQQLSPPATLRQTLRPLRTHPFTRRQAQKTSVALTVKKIKAARSSLAIAVSDLHRVTSALILYMNCVRASFTGTLIQRKTFENRLRIKHLLFYITCPHWGVSKAPQPLAVALWRGAARRGNASRPGRCCGHYGPELLVDCDGVVVPSTRTGCRRWWRRRYQRLWRATPAAC